MSTTDALSRNFPAALLAENVRIYIQIRRAYEECSPEIREVVDEMKAICLSPDSTDDERERALNTAVEALFPGLAADFMGAWEAARHSPAAQARANEMAREEKAFAEKVEARMQELGLTQEQLAARIDVGQSAISNMLKRQCRPQKKTVRKIARALELDPAELWPGASSAEEES